MTQPGAENAAGASDPDGQGAPQDAEAPGAGTATNDPNGTEAGAAEAPAEGGADAQVAELTEALQRERAQFVNFRRRSAEEYKQATAAGKQRLAEKLLPILDDIDRAREHGHLEDGPLKAFADKLGDVLAGEQVVKFGAPGDAFDPELHEAIQNDAIGSDLVIGQALRPGYRLGEKVIRHAMVTVTDAAPSGAAADDPQAGVPAQADNP